MSHRGFQESSGTPFHFSWNNETVVLNNTTDLQAIVDLEHPVNSFERGKGVVARGKVMLQSDESIKRSDYLMIRGDRWEIDNARKSEDGNRIWWVVRHEQQTSGGMYAKR